MSDIDTRSENPAAIDPLMRFIVEDNPDVGSPHDFLTVMSLFGGGIGGYYATRGIEDAAASHAMTAGAVIKKPLELAPHHVKTEIGGTAVGAVLAGVIVYQAIAGIARHRLGRETYRQLKG